MLNRRSEVKAIEIIRYRRDVRVRTYTQPSVERSAVLKARLKRGKVRELTSRSRRNFLFQLFNSTCDWFAFGTLTYPAEFPNDGLKVRRDRRRFGEWLRKHGFKFATVLEFQDRGAPHIHFVVDKFLPKDDLSKIWFQIVGSGDQRHLAAGTSIEFCGTSDQAISYMAAVYAAKKDKQKEVPPGYKNVGRFWTTSRGLVKPVSTSIDLPTPEVKAKVRTLRKVCVSKIRVKRVQPAHDEHLRKRKVHRKNIPVHFHFGLSGFTVYNASDLAGRLLDGES